MRSEVLSERQPLIHEQCNHAGWMLFRFAQYEAFANSRLYTDQALFDTPPVDYVQNIAVQPPANVRRAVGDRRSVLTRSAPVLRYNPLME